MSSSFGGNRRFVSIAFWLQAIGIAIYLGGWASFSGSSGAGICPGTTAANSRLCSYGWIGFSLGFISVALLGLILYVRAHRILSILFGFFNSSSSIFLGRVFIFAGECVATPGAAFAPNTCAMFSGLFLYFVGIFSLMIGITQSASTNEDDKA